MLPMFRTTVEKVPNLEENKFSSWLKLAFQNLKAVGISLWFRSESGSFHPELLSTLRPLEAKNADRVVLTERFGEAVWVDVDYLNLM